ncbi:hypothetical protein SESBI_34396 [Sesbania bispinosa]|nr:hypothetical protein SESBI_34396 [Sesbania bispinosa]
MGGGGAMRAAAMLAGITTVGIRGVPMAHPAEQSVRSASLSMSAAAVTSWDVEDWEVADGRVLVMEDGEDVPTVVFGGVPNFQEAKAATSELKHAIDKIYLSSNSAECEGSSSVLFPCHSEFETKSRVVEAISNPSVPNHALQAFHLLSASPEVQNVVASIASDPNIWNALVQNPELQDFFQSQQTVEGVLEKMGELLDSNSGNGSVHLLSILHNVKLTVSEMVSSMSNYLHNIFGFSIGGKSFAGADGNNAKANFMDHIAMGGTLMGLIVFVVIVVTVLKRA